MLTAAVRDLHAAYPDQFLTSVRTPSPDIWEHNPHVRNIPDDDGEIIEMHYPLVATSNTNGLHFVNGFRMYLEEQLGMPIPQGPLHGDIHLSWEEKEWPSQAGPEPFWLIISGGKRDFTAKIWAPARWQAVVDHFKGRIRFVQVGEAGHDHPPLDGVLDLRGKTTLRQLIRLVHHAQGVACGVTAIMHLAAAVEVKAGLPARKAVIVAGGREPRNWEAYEGHHFLSNVGSLPCCTPHACWKSRVVALNDGLEHDGKLCLMPTKTDGVVIPRCLDLITVEQVCAAVESALAQS